MKGGESMSHVGNGERDFEGLEGMKPERREVVRQARIEARGIIDHLEPPNISSWADLLEKLDDCRQAALRNARLLDPAFRQRWEQKLRQENEEVEWEDEFSIWRLITMASMFGYMLVGVSAGLSQKLGWIWPLTVIIAAIVTFMAMVTKVSVDVQYVFRPFKLVLRELSKKIKG